MKYDELTLEDLKRMQEVDVRTVNIERFNRLERYTNWYEITGRGKATIICRIDK